MIARMKLLCRRIWMAYLLRWPQSLGLNPIEAERRKKARYKRRVVDLATMLAYELETQEARFSKDVLKLVHELLCLEREPRVERIPEGKR
jgi:hypothetical protein